MNGKTYGKAAGPDLSPVVTERFLIAEKGEPGSFSPGSPFSETIPEYSTSDRKQPRLQGQTALSVRQAIMDRYQYLEFSLRAYIQADELFAQTLRCGVKYGAA